MCRSVYGVWVFKSDLLMCVLVENIFDKVGKTLVKQFCSTALKCSFSYIAIEFQ